jgi:RNA polymerase sigma-70 factor (ECF subfamily)
MQPAMATAAPAESDILALLQSGALQRAFALLLDRYEGKVYRLCCTMLRDPTQAQDAAQESWVRVWKALPRYDERASLATWIYTITRNRCLSAIERRRDLTSLDAEELAEEGLEATQPDPEGGSALLRALVDLLPERYRQALVLFYYEDRSVSEVAQMLAMPEGTVKTNLFRARAALTRELRRRGLDDPDIWLGVRS